ncbi:MAG: MATE family efflux transporter [Proteobacteria bacterium]|nr:MATE family efflux transporter [Pseudomonadota bacterium]
MLVTSNTNELDVKVAINSTPKGNLYALWMICFPLIVTAMSGSLMHFLDRIILAKYDTNSMIVATTAGNIAYIFQFGAMSIAMIAEVFVGQFNGAGQYKNVGQPVWQMIWFSIICAFIMIPLGLFGQSFFIPETLAEEGNAYFKWMMIFGASYPLVGALTGFFVGRGHIKAIAYSVIFANILNLILVCLLVYGVSDYIPEMGAQGAAIATGIAELTVAIGLFIFFLHTSNRKKYHTHQWRFNKVLFFKCIKVGVPNSIGHMAGTAAWAFVMYMLAQRSFDHVTVVTIGFSIWMLFSFITEGLQMGVTAVTSNFIGAKKWDHVSTTLMTGLQLQLILAMLLAIPLVVFPEPLINFFIPMDDNTHDLVHLKDLIKYSCRWLWLAYVFDGMTWVIDGILTAAADTRFIMLMNSLGTWVFCLVPIYLFVVKLEGSPLLTMKLITIFCIVHFACYFFRYKSKKWKKHGLICN